MDKSDEGWWKGQLGHAIGFFPSNYIEQISEDEVSNTVYLYRASNCNERLIILLLASIQLLNEFFRLVAILNLNRTNLSYIKYISVNYITVLKIFKHF